MAEGFRGYRYAAVAQAILPVAILIVAASVREARVAALAILAVGWVLAGWRVPRAAPAWAATIPVAVSLAWGIFPQPVGAPDGSDCTNLASPPAIWRLEEACLALAATTFVGWRISVRPAELGLRLPSCRVVVFAAGGFVIAAALGLVLGTSLAEPFFGSFRLDMSRPAALLPALLFAGANGSMEEIVYRGSLQAWLARVAGPRFGLAAQALVFGLAHAGPDVVGPALPLVGAMATGGLIAGLVARRTGSLAIPIALHIAFDLPLYYYWACRVG